MYRRIVVPLDGSKLAECVLPHVKTIAQGNDVPEVLFIRAVEPIVIPYGRQVSKITSIEQLKTFEARHKLEAEKYLRKIEDRFKKAGVKTKIFVINGKAGEAIVNFVTRKKADVVVIATHGRSGVSRLVWGSVADRIVRSVRVPVLLIRAPGCASDFKGD